MKLSKVFAAAAGCTAWLLGAAALAAQPVEPARDYLERRAPPPALPMLAQSSRLFGGQEAQSMQVDLLPDDDSNVIKARSGRSILVAILGSEGLDVDSINPRTIRLNGVDVMLVGKSDKSLCRKLDLNADGFLDLLCEVRTTGFRVSAGDYLIRLEAETYNKDKLRGEDRLKIVRD